MLNGSGFARTLTYLGPWSRLQSSICFAAGFQTSSVKVCAGSYNKQVDVSFRWGMSWFIFSEVMFFAAFFGALILHHGSLSVPWLGGEGAGFATHMFLWPDFAGGMAIDDRRQTCHLAGECRIKIHGN